MWLFDQNLIAGRVEMSRVRLVTSVNVACCLGIFMIPAPIGRVVQHVLPNAIEFFFVTYDAVKVATLPNPRAGGPANPFDLPGGKGFETTHDFRDAAAFSVRCRGGFQTRPRRFVTVQQNDTMNMVGHNYGCILFNIGIMTGQITPNFADDVSVIIQCYFCVYYVSEQTDSIMDADSYKIRSFG